LPLPYKLGIIWLSIKYTKTYFNFKSTTNRNGRGIADTIPGRPINNSYVSGLWVIMQPPHWAALVKVSILVIFFGQPPKIRNRSHPIALWVIVIWQDTQQGHPRWGLAADFGLRRTADGVLLFILVFSCQSPHPHTRVDFSIFPLFISIFYPRCWICKAFPSTRATNRQPLNACCHIQLRSSCPVWKSWVLKCVQSQDITPQKPPPSSACRKIQKKKYIYIKTQRQSPDSAFVPHTFCTFSFLCIYLYCIACSVCVCVCVPPPLKKGVPPPLENLRHARI